MNLFLSHIKLQEHIKANKHLKFNLPKLPSLTWENILDCLSYNIKNDLPYRELGKGGMILWDYYPSKEIKDIVQQFQFLEPTAESNAHIYISLTDVAHSLPMHRDKTAVIYWQAIGKVEFSVKQDFKTYNYVLEPNDCLFIPRNVLHRSKTLTPRVGISLGFEET